MRQVISPAVLLALCITMMWNPMPVGAALGEGLANPFFAFDDGAGRGKWTPPQQAETLKALGYVGIGYTGTDNLTQRLKTFDAHGLKVFSLYVPCYVGKEVPFSPQLKEAMKQLEGRETMLWLTVQGKGSDEQAVRPVVREIADVADQHGMKVATYTHHGFYVATARHAVRLVKKIDHDNVGVSINLCHELRAGNGEELGQIVKESAPYLYLVSINGADHEGGWDRLIKTLDQGEYDVLPFLQALKSVGYTGPIGLQCYNVKGDQRENLKASMGAWRKLSARAQQSGTPESDGWVKLFDGKSLAGWHIACKQKDKGKTYWSVKDGTITCDSRQDKDHDYVWLMSDAEYGDFELRLKVRGFRDSKGNSGVQVRSRYDAKKGWLDGPQVDIHPPTPWRTGLIYDETRETRRWVSPSLPNWKIDKSHAPAGWKWKYADEGDGWNDLRIVCKGTRISTWLNGVQMADFDGDGILNDDAHRKHDVGMKGHIALQLHSRDQLLIQFKAIHLKSLD